jgi:putative transcriptional regulator
MNSTQPSPTFHPAEELLFQHAGGALPLARRVMLESHLAFCPECRTAAAELSRPGGQHLRSLAAEAAAPAALWQKIAAKVAREMAAPRNLLEDTPLPAAARAELPPFYQPLEWGELPGAPAKLTLLVADREAELELYLINNPPETTFPYHRHLGSEDLLILQGGLTDQYGHYQAGDLQQYEKGSSHEPLIDAGITCWAITCVKGGVSWER